MILLKMTIGKETSFMDSQDVDHFSIDFNKISKVLKGKLEFFNFSGKWYVKNSSSSILKYGHFRFPLEATKRLRYEKKIIINELSIEQVRFLGSKKGLKAITAGEANTFLNLTKKTDYIIGRDPSCDIIINNPQVDLFNTKIIYSDEKHYIQDLASSNGLIINDKKMKRKVLADYDVIEIPGTFFTYYKGKLIYSTSKKGIRIDVVNLSKQVKDASKKPILLLQDISFSIKEGEFVAIVGGSGAGKSTTLDAINGLRMATGGHVYYDLNDFYSLKNCYQKIIGNVPQKDIMHSDLSVINTLYYYAQIRMQHKLNKKEILDICYSALKDVSLLEKKDLRVDRLSGGQKKRVSIAMELLSNPKVLFLDEPTSGLSPDLDYEIMDLLKELATKQGKTIIVITHNMENVDKCDKIAFLGNGGRLCYFGTPSEIFSYFKVEKYGAIFSLLSKKEEVEKYAAKLKKDSNYKKMLLEQEKIFKEVAYVPNEKTEKSI